MKITVEFKTVNDLPAKVRVFVNMKMDPPPFFAGPPHASCAPVLAYLDRGSNDHGSLNQTLYACTDIDWDPTRIVLWSGDTGSQSDDDIGRLTAIAWIVFEDQDEQEDQDAWSFKSHPPLLAAMLTAVLSEWIRAEWIRTDATLDASDILDNSDILDQAAVDECWATANNLAKLPPN
jgi:hypothetical protein